MLTLTRRVGQKIMIGKGIVIEVRDIRGTQVRIGIIAPGLAVDREEVMQTDRASISPPKKT